MTSAGQQPVTVADLRPIDLFDDLDDQALMEWAAVCQWRNAEAGERLIEEGAQPEGVLCLLEGRLLVFSRNGERFEQVGQQTGPTWIAAVSTLTETPIGVRMVAVTPARSALVPAPEFRRLALAYPTVHRRVMRQVAPLMHRISSIEQNRERLAALGKMSAGLAHELGNPAAAASRAAHQLAEALEVMTSALRQFVEAGVDPADTLRLADLRDEALRRAAERGPLAPLEAADAEEAMLRRLEELGVPDAWQLAEPLALAGVDEDWLERGHAIAGRATPEALRVTVAWLNAQKIIGELRDTTDRMEGLIKAIKAYAYMDRGGLVEADVHEGLETTLTVLHHKLKHTQIEIDRQYDRDLPKLTFYGSELNQVWTNLIANAIDAVGEAGTITVRTRRDGDCVLVDVADTGPGIPPDARPHIFEPFFTTKDVGQGTGLGLDTARRIVAERHGGSMTFDTGEDGTTFHVWLPLRPSLDRSVAEHSEFTNPRARSAPDPTS
jgi:signal transduction histidine kinase